MKKHIAIMALSMALPVMSYGGITVYENDANGLDFTYSWADQLGEFFGYGTFVSVDPVTVFGKDGWNLIQYRNTIPYLAGLSDLGLYFDPNTLPAGKSLSLPPSLQISFPDQSNPILANTVVFIWRPDPETYLGWWDQPAVEEAVPGDPYAVHIVYNRSTMPQGIPDNGGGIALMGFSMLVLGLARVAALEQPGNSQ
jgi:hypothetical protein